MRDAFCLCLLRIVIVTAATCGIAESQTLRITSTDGELTATIPGDWEQVNLHAAGAQIQVVNNARHMAMLATSVRNADNAGSLESYAAGSIRIILGRLTESSQSDGVPLWINRQRALQYELHGTLPKTQIRIVYILTFIETDAHLLQVAASTEESRFAANGAELRRIAAGISDRRPAR